VTLTLHCEKKADDL